MASMTMPIRFAARVSVTHCVFKRAIFYFNDIEPTVELEFRELRAPRTKLVFKLRTRRHKLASFAALRRKHRAICLRDRHAKAGAMCRGPAGRADAHTVGSAAVLRGYLNVPIPVSAGENDQRPLLIVWTVPIVE
jgi:hypothetical protein